MNKLTLKYVTSVCLVAVSVAAILSARSVRMPKAGPGTDQGHSRVTGPETAPIIIVEFVDYRCAPCAAGSRWLKEFMAAHPGRIRLEVKFFSVHQFPLGPLSFQYAECASRQGRFWEFHDALFERQYQWQGMRDPSPFFRGMAFEMGMNMDDLGACLTDPNVRSEIDLMKLQGETLGVQATPTYFINGEMVVGRLALEKKLTETAGQTP